MNVTFPQLAECKFVTQYTDFDWQANVGCEYETVAEDGSKLKFRSVMTWHLDKQHTLSMQMEEALRRQAWHKLVNAVELYNRPVYE